MISRVEVKPGDDEDDQWTITSQGDGGPVEIGRVPGDYDAWEVLSTAERLADTSFNWILLDGGGFYGTPGDS